MNISKKQKQSIEEAFGEAMGQAITLVSIDSISHHSDIEMFFDAPIQTASLYVLEKFFASLKTITGYVTRIRSSQAEIVYKNVIEENGFARCITIDSLKKCLKDIKERFIAIPEDAVLEEYSIMLFTSISSAKRTTSINANGSSDLSKIILPMMYFDGKGGEDIDSSQSEYFEATKTFKNGNFKVTFTDRGFDIIKKAEAIFQKTDLGKKMHRSK